jgi:hypothetical protein
VGLRNSMADMLKEGSPEMALVGGRKEPQSHAPQTAVESTAPAGGAEPPEAGKTPRKGARSSAKPVQERKSKPAAPDPVEEPAPDPVTRVAAPAAAPRRAPLVVPAEAAEDEAQEAGVKPHYSKLLRKELRLYEDQSTNLSVLRKHINQGKVGAERVTDNTLVRIAIDLLLERSGELKGMTENELRSSVGLDPRY